MEGEHTYPISAQELDRFKEVMEERKGREAADIWSKFIHDTHDLCQFGVLESIVMFVYILYLPRIMYSCT